MQQNVAEAGKTMGKRWPTVLATPLARRKVLRALWLRWRAPLLWHTWQTKAKTGQVRGRSGTGPAYPFVMAGLLTAGMALMNRINSSPGARRSCLRTHHCLVGDNRNAWIDPEVIAPLSKLKDMIGGNRVEGSAH